MQFAKTELKSFKNCFLAVFSFKGKLKKENVGRNKSWKKFGLEWNEKNGFKISPFQKRAGSNPIKEILYLKTLVPVVISSQMVCYLILDLKKTVVYFKFKLYTFNEFKSNLVFFLRINFFYRITLHNVADPIKLFFFEEFIRFLLLS